MMFALNGYFFRRHWKKLVIFLAAVMALSLYALFFVWNILPENTAIQSGPDGTSVLLVTPGMRVYEDPAAVTGSSLLRAFVAFMAVWIVWKERKFWVTLSRTRWQTLLGSLGFLLSLSLILAVCSVVFPILLRLALYWFGFRLRKAWSLNVILTGGDGDWWKMPVDMLIASVQAAGIWTLLGAVWCRWWKQLLCVGAAGIGLIFLLAYQIRWLDILEPLREWIFQFVIDFFDVYLPRIQEIVGQLHQHYVLTWLARLLEGAACGILTYPVVRGMKIIK